MYKPLYKPLYYKMNDTSEFDDTTKLFLLSTSHIKKEAVVCIGLRNPNKLMCVDVTDHTKMPPQPVGFMGGLQCAITRVKLFKQNAPHFFNPSHDVIISIENFIVPSTRRDVCCVYIEIDGQSIFGYSNDEHNPIYPEEYYTELGDLVNFDGNIGHSITIGQIVNKYNPEFHSNNWAHAYCGSTRHNQIINAYCSINKVSFLKKFVKYEKIYPNSSVLFSDLTTLFSNRVLENMLYSVIISKIINKFSDTFDGIVLENMLCSVSASKIINVYNGTHVDNIIESASEEFICDTTIAKMFNVGFVTTQKIGKLETNCYVHQFEKSEIIYRIMFNYVYDPDVLYIEYDSIKPGSTVLKLNVLECEIFNGTEQLCEKHTTMAVDEPTVNAPSTTVITTTIDTIANLIAGTTSQSISQATSQSISQAIIKTYCLFIIKIESKDQTNPYKFHKNVMVCF